MWVNEVFGWSWVLAGILVGLGFLNVLERLRREGRLLADGAWERCTLFDVNHIPTGMSPQRLRQGLIDLARRLYDRNFIEERRQRFFRELRGSRAGASRQQGDSTHEA
jgi:hypothetical protein